MQETEAVCRALEAELPRLHPALFGDYIVARYVNFSAYEVIAADGAHYIVKIRLEPSAEDGPEDYQYWLSWHSADNKEIWIHQHVHPDVPVPTRIDGGFGRLPVKMDDGDAVVRIVAYQIQTRLPYEIAPIVQAQPWGDGWSTSGVMHVSPEFQEITRADGLLTRIGRMARIIHQTPTRGYGGGWFSRRQDFNAATQSFDFPSWEAMVDHLVANCDVQRLIEHGILTLSTWDHVRQRAARLQTLRFAPQLFHGDLICNLQNVLVDAQSGEIMGVVDWESSGSGPTPQYEFAMALRTWYRDGWPEAQIQENFNAFLRGYGISLEEYNQVYRYDVNTIVVLLTLDLFSLAFRNAFTLRRGGRDSLKRLVDQIIPPQALE